MSPVPTDRRDLILATLERDRVVNTARLASDLGVRQITIRRDLERLELDGLLVRIRGGAVPALHGAGVSGTVGVLVPTVHYFWPQVVRAMEAEAHRHGLTTTMRVSAYDATDELEIVQGLVETTDPVGLLLAPRTDAPSHQKVIDWLATCGIPHVLVEREATSSSDGLPLESVNSDRALGAALAVRHLTDLGHRRIGLVRSLLSQGLSPLIVDGWRDACSARNLPDGEQYEWLIPESRDTNFADAVECLLDDVADSGVTGLLVHADPEALPIMQRAQARGISVPDRLSVVAYDDEVAALFTPPMTAISPIRDTLGEIAIQLLIGRIADPMRPARRVLLNPQLNVRQSTGPAPA